MSPQPHEGKYWLGLEAGKGTGNTLAECSVPYLSTTVRASWNRAANMSPVKYSARRPTAWSKELRSRREQWRRRQSFSAVMFSR